MAYTTPITAVTGAVAAAADWNSGVRDNLAEIGPHKRVWKSADETVANNTLQSDDHLKFNMAAKEKCRWDMCILYAEQSSTAANFKVARNAPAGSGGWLVWLGVTIGSANTTISNPTLNSQYVDGSTTSWDGAGGALFARGGIVNGGTPGDVQLRW